LLRIRLKFHGGGSAAKRIPPPAVNAAARGGFPQALAAEPMRRAAVSCESHVQGARHGRSSKAFAKTRDRPQGAQGGGGEIPGATPAPDRGGRKIRQNIGRQDGEENREESREQIRRENREENRQENHE
jgi:hypothetical protein